MIQILLIEDNTDDIELALREFERLNIADTVHLAKTGEDALAFLHDEKQAERTANIKLILLDLGLPQAPGMLILQRMKLHKMTKHIPVVVLTVSKKDPDLLQTFTMGVSEYLIKPIDPTRFSTLYDKYVRGAS